MVMADIIYTENCHREHSFTSLKLLGGQHDLTQSIDSCQMILRVHFYHVTSIKFKTFDSSHFEVISIIFGFGTTFFQLKSIITISRKKF